MQSPSLLVAFVIFVAVAAKQKEPLEAYTEALTLASHGELDVALQILQNIIDEAPCFDRSYGKFVTLSERAGHTMEARAYLDTRSSASTCGKYGLAVYLRSRHELDKAAQLLHECIRLEPDYLPAYGELVNVEVLRKHDGDLESLLSSSVKSKPGSAGLHYGLGHLYAIRQEWIKAMEHLNEAKQLSREAWEVQEDRHYVLYQTDNLDQALITLGEMLRANVHDPEREGTALGLMGMAYADRGDYEQAVPSLRRAIDLISGIGDKSQEEIFRGNLGLAYIYTARFDEALAECGEALRLARELKILQDEGRNLGLLAGVQAQRANYTEAIENYNSALTIARQTNDRPSEADQLASLSLVYAALGDQDQALELISEALSLSAKLDNPWLEGHFQEIRGSLLADAGRYKQAKESYSTALKLAQRIGDKLGEATRLAYGGEIEVALKNYRGAQTRLEEANHLTLRIGARLIEGRILNDLGGVFLAQGNSFAARRCYEDALALADQTGMLEVSWRAYSGLSKTVEAAGRIQEALEWNRKAIDAIEHIRGRIGMPEEKAGFLESKIDVYKHQIDLLLVGDQASAHMPEAFECSERAHARSFLDSIAESDLSLPSADGGTLSARQREIESRLSQLQTRIEAAYSKGAPDALLVKDLVGRLARADEEYREVRREIRKHAPDYAAFRYPQPLSLEDVQRFVPNDALVLAFSLSSRHSFLFAIARNERRVIQLPPRAAIAQRVRRLREALSLGPSRTALGTYLAEAAALTGNLLEPAKNLMQGKRELIVIPDGALHYLPFAVLFKPGATLDPEAASSRVPYLIREYRIRYAQSVSVLVALQARTIPSSVGTKTLLAVGSPTYYRVKGPLTRGLSYGRLSNLPYLPQSLIEVKGLAKLYPPNSVTLLTGQAATEENVKASLSNHRVLHFAVHSAIDEVRPEFSGLVFARPPTEAKDNGILQVYEILNLRLKADLVILSACDTGLGKQSAGEGLVGLTQAFLYAGSGGVVVSLWEVQDRSTAELMLRFHSHLRRANATASEALRQAQLSLIDERRFAHPYFWAAFSLIGGSG